MPLRTPLRLGTEDTAVVLFEFGCGVSKIWRLTQRRIKGLFGAEWGYVLEG